MPSESTLSVYPSLSRLFLLRLKQPKHTGAGRSHYRMLLLVWLSAVMLLGGTMSRAQFDAAAVLGTIKDRSGAVIPGTAVVLTNIAKNVSVTSTTDSYGDFQFPVVQIGEYRMMATKEGFQVVTTERFTVRIGARQRVDMELNLGAASQEVTVNGTAALLETDTSDRGQEIAQRELVNLPLNGRAYADLTLLVPGVRKSLIENGTILSRDASYNVNGMRSNANNFLLDGLDNNAYQEANQGYSNQAIIPSPDALQAFRVQTNNYAAEFGRAGGAVINVSFRSGTNAFHGVVYDYLRNTVLNAYGPFLGTGVKPTLIQNQFGATLAGPILKDKLFFFADYEGLRHIDRSLQTATVPTMGERQGVFVAADGVTPIAMRNPITGATYANGVVPASAQSAFASNVLSLLPAPNLNVPLGQANYSSNPANTVTDDHGDARIDAFLSSKMTLFGRYSQRQYTIFAAPPITGLAGGNSNGTLYARTRQVASGITYNLTPRTLIEARFGITLTHSGKAPYNLGAANLVTFPNAPTDPSVIGGVNSQIVTGFSQFGRQTTNPQFTDPYLATPKVTLSFIRGRHTMKVGYEYGWLTQAISDFHPKFGADTYAGQFSRTTATASSNTAITGANNLADFLLGARSHYELNNIAEVNYQRRWHYGFVQDDWKVNNRLTLNYGLRYEFLTPYWAEDNHLVNFDPTTNSLLLAKNGSLYDRGLVDPKYTGFAPRFGLAFVIDPKTVLRGGYALSYAPYFRFGGESLLAYNGPYVVDATIDQTPPIGFGAASKPLPACAGNEDPTTCFRTTQQGYTPNFASSASFSTLKAQTRYMQRDTPTPYSQTTYLGVQRDLTHGTLLDVAWVWNHAVHLPALTDYNQATPQNATCQSTPSTCVLLQARRPISTFTNILATIPVGFLQYHALQVKLEKRYSQGIYLLNSFTWSHGIDNVASDLENANGDSNVVNRDNVAGDRGRSGYDQPINNTTSLVWDLPYGKGRRFGTSAPFLLQEVLGGWQVTAIEQVTSGLPVNLVYSPNTNAQISTTSASYGYRASLTGPVSSVYNPSSAWVKTATQLGNVFNNSGVTFCGAATAGTNPAVCLPNYAQPFGNAGRNTLRGAAYGSLDLGLHKRFVIYAERVGLEFRAEAFNVLNATNYQSPNSTANNSSFGAYTSAYASRQLQLAVRLSY
ncbi:MAG: Cna domain protein [Acidobacteriaceae bacterium]|nr:Cna domain protein [Acidobacteriaceae bacterium]